MECKLRTWSLDHAKALATLLNNKKILDNLRDGIPYPYTVSDAEAFISEILNSQNEQIYSFAILADNRLAGSITLYRQNNIHRLTAEIGYYIGEEFWNKGLGSKAIKMACNYIFEHTDILRIFAMPFTYNTASCRLLEKCGFKYEGTLAKNAIKNGAICDMQMYAILKSDQ